jgi:hypothetical protein
MTAAPTVRYTSAASRVLNSPLLTAAILHMSANLRCVSIQGPNSKPNITHNSKLTRHTTSYDGRKQFMINTHFWKSGPYYLECTIKSRQTCQHYKRTCLLLCYRASMYPATNLMLMLKQAAVLHCCFAGSGRATSHAVLNLPIKLRYRAALKNARHCHTPVHLLCCC